MADSLSFRQDNGASKLNRSSIPREAVWILIAIAVGLGFAAVNGRTVLTIVIAALLFLVSLERPIVGVSTLIGSVPLQDAWSAQIDGFSTTWTRVVLLIVISSWLIRFCLGRESIRPTASGVVFASFLGALALSIVHVREINAWGEELYRWGVALFVFIIVSSLRLTRRDLLWIYGGLAAGVVLCFVVALNQVLTSSGPETFQQRGLTRAFGYFGEPNPLAGFLEMASLPLLAVGLSQFKRFNRNSMFETVTLLVAGSLGSVTILLTQSRGGLLGFSAGCAVLIWVLFPVWGRRFVLAGILASSVVIWLPVAASLRRVLGIESLLSNGPTQVTSENWATEERIAHWGAALRMWASEPWLGIGAGNFNERFREFTPTWRFRISRGHAHSAYLQAAAQAGVVGIVLYLSLFVAVTCRALTGLREATPSVDRGVWAGLLAVTGAIAVHGLFDYLHVLSLGIVLSVIWALNVPTEVEAVGESVKHVGD